MVSFDSIFSKFQSSLFISSYQLQIKVIMLKHTDETAYDFIVQLLQNHQRSEQKNRILLNVFGSALSWFEERFDSQSKKDAVSRMRIKEGIISNKLTWIYVVKGHCNYNGIRFSPSEFIKLEHSINENLKLQTNGCYAFLTVGDMEWIQNQYQERKGKKLLKFLRQNLFYTQYLQEKLIRQFLGLIKMEHLSYNSLLNWNDQDYIPKIAIIYKGSISIQCQWKRNIQIAEITKGMLFCNQFTCNRKNDQLQTSKGSQRFNLKYSSKSDKTTLFIFDANVLRQNPYNINQGIFDNLAAQYEKYIQILRVTIKTDQEWNLYRRKKSIKQELKQYEKERVCFNSTVKVNNKSKQVASNVKSSSIQREQSSPEHCQSDRNHFITQHLSTSLITLSNYQTQQLISKTSLVNLNPCLTNRTMVHNSWIQTANKKPRSLKSFSNMQKIRIHHQERQKRNQQTRVELKSKKKPNFFIPEQFIKKKLKIQFETLIDKMKYTDLSLREGKESSLKDRLKRLEQQVDSNRIVKLEKSRKCMFLREKFQD